MSDEMKKIYHVYYLSHLVSTHRDPLRAREMAHECSGVPLGEGQWIEIESDPPVVENEEVGSTYLLIRQKTQSRTSWTVVVRDLL